MILLKLGGSVITEKGSPETVDRAALDEAAAAVAAADQPVVLVHGAGSFGHFHADHYGLTPEDGTHDPDALLDVHDAMKRLNRTVLEALRAYDLSPAPVHPFSMASRDREGELTFPTGHVQTMIDEGFTPVLHGDGVVHAGEGVTILSGDEVIVELAEQLGPDRIGLCSTVPGVLRDGDVIDRIDDFEEVADVLGGSDATDVTGGMAGKVRQLLALSVPATIFGREDLAAFLDGQTVGTTIGDSR